MLDSTQPDIAKPGWSRCCKLVMRSNVGRGRTRLSPRARLIAHNGRRRGGCCVSCSASGDLERVRVGASRDFRTKIFLTHVLAPGRSQPLGPSYTGLSAASAVGVLRGGNKPSSGPASTYG